MAVYCTESPEVRFDDVQTIHVSGRKEFSVEMCPEYVHTCEAGTIQAVGHSVDEPAMVGLKVEEGNILVKIVEAGRMPSTLVVHLSGIRSGMKDVRHEPKTEAQAKFNNAFWSIPKTYGG